MGGNLAGNQHPVRRDAIFIDFPMVAFSGEGNRAQRGHPLDQVRADPNLSADLLLRHFVAQLHRFLASSFGFEEIRLQAKDCLERGSGLCHQLELGESEPEVIVGVHEFRLPFDHLATGFRSLGELASRQA